MAKAGKAVDETTVYSFIKRLQPGLRIEAARHRFDTIDEVVSYCNYWLAFNLPSPSKPSVRFSDDAYPMGASVVGVKPPNNRNANNSNHAGFRNGFNQPRNDGRKGFHDRGPTFKPAAPYRPPFKDMGNRGWSTAARPAGSTGHTPAAVATTQSNDIEDLTRSLEKLQINLSQRLAELEAKEHENRHLRHVLQTQVRDGRVGASGQINYLDVEFDDNSAAQDYDPQYLEELLASLFAKHPRDGSDPFLQRAPAKRVAVNPKGNHPYVPARRPPIPSPSETPSKPAPAAAAAAAPVRPQAAANPANRPAPAPSSDPGLYDNAHRMPRQRVPC